MIDILYTDNKVPLLSELSSLVNNLLGDFEKDRLSRYHRWNDRQAYLLGKLLTAILLKKNGYNTKLLTSLKYTAFNRPFIEGIKADFNISHSGEYVICAFSTTQVVGADIERIQTIDLQDFSYILNEDDKNLMDKSENKYASFFKIWSAKEAVLKAHGCGLVDYLDGLEIKGERGFFDEKQYYLKELAIDTLYSGCVASTTPIESIHLEKVYLNNYWDLINGF